MATQSSQSTSIPSPRSAIPTFFHFKPEIEDGKMVGDINYNGEPKAASHNKESPMYGLSTVPTSVALTAEQFERLYLTPMTRRQPPLAKQVGNPTPL